MNGPVYAVPGAAGGSLYVGPGGGGGCVSAAAATIAADDTARPAYQNQSPDCCSGSGAEGSKVRR